MEPSTCRTTESEEHYVEEKECEKCVKEEATIPSTSSQQPLLKADYKTFKNGVPLPIIATKIPKKVIAPIDTGNLEAGRRTRRRKRRSLTINLTNCKYESVRRAAHMCGLKEVGEEEEWTVYWTDCAVSLDQVMKMKRFQKINHFPGMTEICRKDLLARNLNRMHKLYPSEYNIFPRTWCLPADYGDFQTYSRQRKARTYICKPGSGCQGRGIFITQNPREIKPGEHMICQQYISKPFLIDGFKFDMRTYVLITSCDPLRIFVYEEGLARFATTPYVKPSHNNLDNVCMHLTNYAINKHNENFVRDGTVSSKRKEKTEPSQGAMLDQEQYEDSHLGKYRRIYPGPNTEKYACFFKHNGSLFQETAASKAREECARQQLEEIRLKQEQQENSGTKRQKAKDQNQSESAGEKSRPRPGLQSLSTCLVYRNHNWEKQLLPGQLDTMRPQEIVEEEELERLKALLQREVLIRSLGIVEQLTRLQYPDPQGQKKLHECRVRVPVKPPRGKGNKGCCPSTWLWPHQRRLL
ncbi:tubulin polyglutamylase TTLL13 isoform X6 [Callithrix jacchus]